MSQRWAPMPAATATADVSEPPRPRVEMRSPGATPWNPATTATSPRSTAFFMSEAGTASIRAEPCTAEVLIGTCQPSQERALMPMAFNVMARSPLVICSPAATTTSYSRWSGTGCRISPRTPSTGGLAASLVHATSLLVSPAMAETTTATLLPRSTSRLTSIATWRMRSMSATEVPPNFIAIKAIARFAPEETAAYVSGVAVLLNPRTLMADSASPDSSIDPGEVAKFSAIAAQWWDPAGKFAPLHKFNPVRLAFIRAEAAGHFGRDARSLRPFRGLSLLDIGCGGGLLAEPMARLGFAVTGADASEKNIGTAKAHAVQSGLAIDYRAASAESLAAEGLAFDLVLNM